MNSKAIRKQLLAAVAMVLVAAVALGSSTYAWFASNNKVTATGMTVNAQAEGSLLVISTSTTLGNSTSVAMNLTGAKLFPTHLTTALNGTPAMTGASSSWRHSFSKEYSAAITDTDTSSETTLNLSIGSTSKNVYGSTTEKQVATQYYDAEGKQYFLAGKLYIGLDKTNTAAKCGKISLTDFTIASTDSSTLLPSARVALVNLSTYDDSADDNKTTDVNELKGVIATNAKKVKTIGDFKTADTLEALGTGIEITDANLEAGDYVEVGVYIYFDGRDDACTSANYDTKDTTVSLTFTAADPT